MRVGLVLGGGGVIGLAYHAAALAAIEHDLAWDPRSADVVVGTSAGSLAGALLRRGVPASDLSAVTVGAHPRSSPPGVAEALRDRPRFPPVRLGSFLARPRLPNLRLVTAWARRPWRLDPIAALVSVLPDGSLDMVARPAGRGAGGSPGALVRAPGAGWCPASGCCGGARWDGGDNEPLVEIEEPIACLSAELIAHAQRLRPTEPPGRPSG